MASLTGKIALITGSSRGIGRAVALELAERGADVVVNYVSHRAAAMEVVAAIENKGRRALCVRANVGNSAEIRELFAAAKASFGGLDIFVSNAVSAPLRPALDLKDRHWQYIFDVNMKAFAIGVQEAVPLMEGRRGKIIAISSVGSRRYIPGYAALGAAKAAIECLTHYLALELASKGINVNAVCGGPIETEALKAFPDHEALKARWVAMTPAGRLGRPEDLAKIIAFLCSDDAEWIRGQVIVADGGLSLGHP